MKKALITGTSKGIGYSLAEHLLSKGWLVYGCSRSIGSICHTNYRHFQVDLSDQKSVKIFTELVLMETTSLDLLINNAAISSTNLIMLMTDEKIMEIFNTNLISSFFLIRNFIRLLSKSAPSLIVNISSPISTNPRPHMSAYGATKVALDHLTISLAAELKPLKISINSISPGMVDTNLLKNIPDHIQQQSLKDFGLNSKTTFVRICSELDSMIEDMSVIQTGKILTCD